MDVTTFVGILGGLGLIIFSIMSSGDLADFFDPASFMIVLGGTLAAVIASFPFGTLKNVFKHTKKLLSGKQYKVEPIIETLVEFAQIARSSGLLALEEQANQQTDPFIKSGLMMVVDATEPEKVLAMLEADVASMDARHEGEIQIYDKAAGYAPAFGMIGTLIGLINMLQNMDMSSGASDTLGTSMAIAMITTLYGCLFSNLIFAPIAKKLRVRNDEEILYKTVIIEGIVGIQAGENPKALKERLASLLREKARVKVLGGDGDSGKGKKKK